MAWPTSAQPQPGASTKIRSGSVQVEVWPEKFSVAKRTSTGPSSKSQSRVPQAVCPTDTKVPSVSALARQVSPSVFGSRFAATSSRGKPETNRKSSARDEPQLLLVPVSDDVRWLSTSGGAGGVAVGSVPIENVVDVPFTWYSPGASGSSGVSM